MDRELLQFIQSKGFIWGPSPEIYGGVAGFYTYGPMGKLLKNRVEEKIRSVFSKSDFWEVECPTVVPKAVWKASGHLEGFTDPMIKCTKCNATFRVDNLLEEKGHESSIKDEDMLKNVKNANLKCPTCGGAFEDKILRHNLMMKTTIGLDTEAYNRPETATTTYLPFIRYADFFRKKLPFSVFQIGKAYRNEISPRQHLLRMREFTQAEGQMFIEANMKNNFEPFKKIKKRTMPLWSAKLQHEKKIPADTSLDKALKENFIKSQAYAWTLNLVYELFLAMGIPKDKLRFRQHFADEKAFYADDAWDLEVKTNSYGWVEMAGIHDRTNYDLLQHTKESGKTLAMEGNIVPHVLEIAFGVDRPVFALLDLFYEYKDKGEGKTTFNIPYDLAPVQVAVLPLMKKDKLPEKARKVFDLLKEQFTCRYDENGAIGRRYLRENQMGTPYCVTIDYDSIKNDDVTIRDRDSGKQTRVKVKKLVKTLNEGAK
jgi:glycyl-tRNA synthetase